MGIERCDFENDDEYAYAIHMAEEEDRYFEALQAERQREWEETPVECNCCEWSGELSETVMLGSVGPLCPECTETITGKDA